MSRKNKMVMDFSVAKSHSGDVKTAAENKRIAFRFLGDDGITPALQRDEFLCLGIPARYTVVTED